MVENKKIEIKTIDELKKLGIDKEQLLTKEQHHSIQEQLLAKERYDFINNLYLLSFNIASLISITIVIIGLLIKIELNFIRYPLVYILLALPQLIFGISLLVHLFPLILPLLKFKARKNSSFYNIDYSKIIAQQKNPTTARYRAWKITLIILCTLGVLITLGNIALFIVEIVL